MPINSRALFTPRFLSKALADAPKNYIAATLFPPLVNETRGGPVANVDKNRELLRRRSVAVADGAIPETVVIQVDQSLTYYCDKYAVQRTLADEEFASAQEPATIALRGATQAVSIYLLQRENRLAAKIAADWTGGSYTGTPSTKWDNVASGTPIADITARIAQIQSRCGYRPNVIGSDVQVIDKIYNVDEVQENIRYTQTISSQPGDPGARAALLAGRLGLDTWAVASNANNNTAGYGAAPTLTAIWSDNVFLGNNSLNDVQGATSAAGIHATWNGTDVGGIVNGLRVEEYRDEAAGGYNYKVTGYEHALTLDINRGFWFTDVLT